MARSIEEELFEDLYRGIKNAARLVRRTFSTLRRLLRGRARGRQPVGAPGIGGPDNNVPPGNEPELSPTQVAEQERQLNRAERRAMTEAVLNHLRNNPEARAQLDNLSEHRRRMLLHGLVERALDDDELRPADAEERRELEQGVDGPDIDPLDLDGNHVLDTRDRELEGRDVNRLSDRDGDGVPETLEHDREDAQRAQSETTGAEQNAQEPERQKEDRGAEPQEQDRDRERQEGLDVLPAAAAGAAVAEGLDGQDQPEAEVDGQAADQPEADGQEVDQPALDAQAEADRDGPGVDQPAVDAEADQVQPVVDEQAADREQADRAEGDPQVGQGEVARDDIEVDRDVPVAEQDQAEREPQEVGSGEPAVDQGAANRDQQAEQAGPDRDEPSEADQQAQTERDSQEAGQADQQRDPQEIDQAEPDRDPQEVDQAQPVVDQVDRAETEPQVEQGEAARDDVQVDRQEPEVDRAGVDPRDQSEVEQPEPERDGPEQGQPERDQVEQDGHDQSEQDQPGRDEQDQPGRDEVEQPGRDEVEQAGLEPQVEREQGELDRNEPEVDGPQRDQQEQDRQGPEAEQNQQESGVETSALPTGGDLHAEAQAREAQAPSGPLEARLNEDRDRENAMKNGERGQGQQGYSQPMSDTEKAKLDSLTREGVAGPAERRPDRQLEPAGQGGRTPGAQHQRDVQNTQDPQDRDRSR